MFGVNIKYCKLNCNLINLNFYSLPFDFFLSYFWGRISIRLHAFRFLVILILLFLRILFSFLFLSFILWIFRFIRFLNILRFFWLLFVYLFWRVIVRIGCTFSFCLLVWFWCLIFTRFLLWGFFLTFRIVSTLTSIKWSIRWRW